MRQMWKGNSDEVEDGKTSEEPFKRRESILGLPYLWIQIQKKSMFTASSNSTPGSHSRSLLTLWPYVVTGMS